MYVSRLIGFDTTLFVFSVFSLLESSWRVHLQGVSILAFSAFAAWISQHRSFLGSWCLRLLERGHHGHVANALTGR